MSVIRQLSLFGVEASPPEPGDLAGLMIAGGEIAEEEGAAQVSILVGHPWRAAAIVSECARRGISATSLATSTTAVGVRTSFTPALLDLARSWTGDAGDGGRPPREIRFDARVLRLWAMAVGYRDETSYELPIRVSDEPFRDAVGAALAGLGVAAQLVSRRHSFRIVGKRRLDRLAEMLGDAPRQAPPGAWPS
jgi:hypothetical protein